MKKTNRTDAWEKIGIKVGVLIFVLYWVTIICAIFEPKMIALTILFVLYSIVGAVILFSLIDKKSKNALFSFVLYFSIIEIILIIPCVVIFFIKGIL